MLRTESLRQIEAMPKVDLHVHLDGSLRLDTLYELIMESGETSLLDLVARSEDDFQINSVRDVAQKRGIDLSMNGFEKSDLKNLIYRERFEGGLQEYLVGFFLTGPVMQDKESLSRIAWELAEDAHSHRVRYIEPRFAPFLHTSGGLSGEEVVDAINEGLSKARDFLGIQFSTILCGLRHSPEDVDKVAHLAQKLNRKKIGGFDIAGGEDGGDYGDHSIQGLDLAIPDGFRKILRGVKRTVHAGEAYGIGSISQAVEYLSPSRLGHATTLHKGKNHEKYGDIYEFIKDRNICIEACLTSNYQTGAVSDISKHPAAQYLREGFRVSFGTDNWMVSNTNPTNELTVAHRDLGIPLIGLANSVVAGAKSTFLPSEEQTDLVYRICREMMEVVPEFRMQRERNYGPGRR